MGGEGSLGDSGNARKKTFFFNWGLPLLLLFILGVGRQVWRAWVPEKSFKPPRVGVWMVDALPGSFLIILWRNKEPALTLLFQECTECWDRTGRRIASWRLWNCKLTVRSRQQSIFKTFLKSCFCFWTNSGAVLQNLNILCCAQQAAGGHRLESLND